MEDPMLSPITVEVAHAPSPRADLVAGHVSPAAVAQAHALPSRKRQGNVVVQGGNPAAPAATARAPGAYAVVRPRPEAKKTDKGAGIKRRKFPASRKAPCSTSHSTPSPARRCSGDAVQRCRSPASEVFDEMAGKYASFEPFNYNEMDGGVDDHGYEDDDGSRNLHKPDGDKKTKEKMKKEQEVASLREKIDAMVQSNELMLLKSLEIKKELAEKKAKE
ncbi:Lactation elevated protein 1 [Hordeum vulgare]|nr:Lactation elevated protein 1 [Hordeum vulgare]